jgi:hypothetical protein
MKKILVVLLFLAGLGGYALFSPQPKEDFYAAYLPEDTIFTLRVLGLQQMSQDFPPSALGHFLSVASMQEIMEELGVDAEVLDLYQETYEGLAATLTSPLIQHLFGDDVVFALLPPDPQRLQEDPLRELHQSLLIFGTSKTAKGIDFLARLLLAQDCTREHWAGLNITRIHLDETEALYVYLEGGKLLLAAAPEVLVAAVERRASPSSQDLGHQENFLAAQTFWTQSSGSSQAQVAVQVPPLQQLLAALGLKTRLTEPLQDFSSLAALFQRNQGDFVIQAQARYQPGLGRHRPQQNSSLELLTDQTPLYLWFSAFDTPILQALWSLLGRDAVPLSPEELGAALGSQATVVLQEIVHAGLFPLPRLLLAAEVRHLTKAQALVQQIREGMHEAFREQELTVRGQRVLSWRLLPFELSHPALALTDTILYAGTGFSTIRAVLEQEQEGLPHSMYRLLGPELAEMLTTANLASVFFRPALFASELEKAQTWLALMLHSAHGIQVEKTQVALGHLMQPFDFFLGALHIEEETAQLFLTLRQRAD